MTITDKDYRYIVDYVYKVDTLKVSRSYSNDDFVANDRFKVISSPVSNLSNSHVVISYAGTNSSDIKDLGTDVQSLGPGRDKLQSRSGLNSAKVVDSQFVTALNYADVN